MTQPELRPLLARLCCAALAAALMHTAAWSQMVRVVQAAPLRSERATDAAMLAALPADASVRVLQLSGGWAQVEATPLAPEPAKGASRAAALRGWLRASALELHPPEVALASQLDTGRRAPGATAVTLGSRAFPPRSNRHALIIGLGQYAQDPARLVARLEGLEADMASALAMARALQVPDDNITLLRDEAATSAGIAAAFRGLAARTQPGDRVFIYWSGHGSRYLDEAAGGCVETLIPYDLQDVTNRQLAQWLQPIGAKADKMLVLYDACHSAGVAAPAVTAGPATRALGPALQAKFTPGTDACSLPSNVRTRSLGAAAAALGLSAQDVVHVSSSRPDELSLQDPARGGLATAAFRECLQGDARDTDGSGSISVQELADCAQAKIDQSLVANPRYKPPHIVLTGNRDFVPACSLRPWSAPPPATPHRLHRKPWRRCPTPPHRQCRWPVCSNRSTASATASAASRSRRARSACASARMRLACVSAPAIPAMCMWRCSGRTARRSTCCFRMRSTGPTASRPARPSRCRAAAGASRPAALPARTACS